MQKYVLMLLFGIIVCFPKEGKSYECAPFNCLEAYYYALAYEPCNDDFCLAFSLEPRVSYFYASNGLFRDIYNQGGWMYGLIGRVGSGHLQGFISGDYYYRRGKSIGGHNASQLTFVPVAIGIEYHIMANLGFDFYIGAAPEWHYLLIYDHDGNLGKIKTEKGGWGGLVKAGVIWNFWADFFFDNSIEFAYRWTHIHKSKHFDETRNVNLSGLRFSIGIGSFF